MNLKSNKKKKVTVNKKKDQKRSKRKAKSSRLNKYKHKNSNQNLQKTIFGLSSQVEQVKKYLKFNKNRINLLYFQAKPQMELMINAGKKFKKCLLPHNNIVPK